MKKNIKLPRSRVLSEGHSTETTPETTQEFPDASSNIVTPIESGAVDAITNTSLNQDDVENGRVPLSLLPQEVPLTDLKAILDQKNYYDCYLRLELLQRQL